MKLKLNFNRYFENVFVFACCCLFSIIGFIEGAFIIPIIIFILSFMLLIYSFNFKNYARKNWNKKIGYIIGDTYFRTSRGNGRYYGFRGMVDDRLFDVYGGTLSFDDMSDFNLNSNLYYCLFGKGHGIYNNKAYKYVVSELSHIENLGDGKFRLKSFPIDVYEHNGKYFFDIESIDLSKESTI